MIKKVINSLDIILTWSKIHESVLERYQAKKYFGFQSIAMNESYSRILSSLLVLYIPLSSQSSRTILSLTGIQRLDNLLNLIKGKVLECLNYIFKYVIDQLITQQKMVCPFMSAAPQILDCCIHTLMDTIGR